MARWSTLSTEASNPSSEGLDALSSEDVVSLLLEEDQRGLEAAGRSRKDIAKAASWVAEALEAGGEVLFAGAGTSGRLGILEAAECPPTFGTDPEQIRAVIAGGPGAVFEASEGAEDIAEDGAAAAKELGAGDLLVAVSASSATPFVLGALTAARENVQLDAVRVGIEQDWDNRGVLAMDGARPVPSGTRITIDLASPLPEEDVEDLVARALTKDPWFLTLRDAQPVTTAVSVNCGIA